MDRDTLFDQSKIAYYADWLIAPFLIFISLYSAALCGATTLTAGLLPLGFLLWTFAEYAIHRWIFHGPLRRDHFRHHRQPHGYVAASPLASTIGHAILLSLMLAALAPVTAFMLFAGWMSGYFFYLFVHDSFHHGHQFNKWRTRQVLIVWALTGRGYEGAEHRHNLHHDACINGNYGIAFPLWDILFRTRVR